jgi:predicted Zn-dependent protease
MKLRRARSYSPPHEDRRAATPGSALLGRAGRTYLLALLVAASLLAACNGGDKPAPSAARSVVSEQPTAAAAATIAAASAPSSTAASVDPKPVAAQPTSGASASALYVVALEDFPGSLLDRLQTYFRDKYGLELSVLPAIPLASDVADRSRQQVVGERLIEAMSAASPPDGASSVVIGLTRFDMMLEGKPEWSFAFSLRDNPRRMAVISTARMDPRNFGQPPDDDLLFHRMAKMVAKNVGILYLGLALSTDPASVMYGNVLSVDDLDLMGEDLPPH